MQRGVVEVQSHGNGSLVNEAAAAINAELEHEHARARDLMHFRSHM